MDVLIEDFGREIFVLRAMSDKAQDWVKKEFSDFPVFAGGLVVAPRYIGFVRRQAPKAGLVVAETAFGRSH